MDKQLEKWMAVQCPKKVPKAGTSASARSQYRTRVAGWIETRVSKMKNLVRARETAELETLERQAAAEKAAWIKAYTTTRAQLYTASVKDGTPINLNKVDFTVPLFEGHNWDSDEIEERAFSEEMDVGYIDRFRGRDLREPGSDLGLKLN